MKKTRVRRIRRRKQTRRRKIRGGIGSVKFNKDNKNICKLYELYNATNIDTYAQFEKIDGTDYWGCTWEDVVKLFNSSAQMKSNISSYMKQCKFNYKSDNSLPYNQAVAEIVITDTNNRVIVTGFQVYRDNQLCVLTLDQIYGLADTF
jgi:hypothetical protein